MGEITRFEEDRFLRNHAANHSECICIAHSWHVEVTTLLQRNKEKKN